jgi:hypothetical protein
MKTILSIIAKVCLTIIFLIMVLAAGEMYLRLFSPRAIIPRYVEIAPYGIRKNIGNVKGEMITCEYRHKFNTNSQGFRGVKEYSADQHIGVYRAIVLGDSVALGHGVSDEDTFSSILESRLCRARPSEVINMAVSGFGSAEELVQLINIGFRYYPDLIILAYFPNDPYNNVTSGLFKFQNNRLVRNEKNFVPAVYIRDALYKIPGYSFLCQNSHLLNFIRELISSYFMKELCKEQGVSSTSQSELNIKQKNLTAALINEILTESNKRRIPVIILDIPVAEQNHIFSNLPKSLLKLNNSDYLIDVKNQIYRNYPAHLLYYKKDCHPKPLCHKLIGEFLAIFIKEKLWTDRIRAAPVKR